MVNLWLRCDESESWFEDLVGKIKDSGIWLVWLKVKIECEIGRKSIVKAGCIVRLEIQSGKSKFDKKERKKIQIVNSKSK